MAVRKAYTIGFTKHKASEFFGTLKKAEIKRLIDVRLNNSSQLAGFSKREDLPFFLWELCRAEYSHNALLVPSQELLANYRKKRISWHEYKSHFLKLMVERKVEEKIPQELFDIPTVLLCSEPTAERCHRRLGLEYLSDKWGNLQIHHLEGPV